MSTIEYARQLDWEQQTELELEGEQSLEKIEHKAFVERCRRSKVTYTKLKKYAKEVDDQTADIRTNIDDLERKLKYYKVGSRIGIFSRKVCKQKDIDDWRKQLADKREQLDLIITRLHEKYFK